MHYRVTVSRSAEKEMDALPADAYQHIAAMIDDLAANPWRRGVQKLTTFGDLWRIRVGRYRVIFDIDQKRRRIGVRRIARRSERTYTGLE